MKRQEQGNFRYKDFIIGLGGAVIGLIGGLGTTWMTLSHNSNIQNYEYRKEIYSQFISTYLDYFNNDIIFSGYEEEFNKAINLEGLEEAYYYDYMYHLIQKYPKIKECFYGTPWGCTQDMEESQEDLYDRNSISEFIGTCQKRAVETTLDQNLKKFRDKTFPIRLLMDNDMYEDIMRKIAGKIYVAPSPWYGCEFPEMSGFSTERYGAECGFNFSPYMGEDKYTTVYGFSFIDEEIFDILRKDLEKYQ